MFGRFASAAKSEVAPNKHTINANMKRFIESHSQSNGRNLSRRDQRLNFKWIPATRIVTYRAGRGHRLAAGSPEVPHAASAAGLPRSFEPVGDDCFHTAQGKERACYSIAFTACS
jgi:hypothetical protein